MSAKKSAGFAIAVDSSVARASGSLDSEHPLGTNCRACLEALRGAGHGVAWNERFAAEWGRHQSRFATTWLTTMRKIGKVRFVDPDPVPEVRHAVETHGGDRRDALLKDAFLIEAALKSDQRVLSLDDKARGHWRVVCPAHPAVGALQWANPRDEADQAVAWFASGAPVEAARRIDA